MVKLNSDMNAEENVIGVDGVVNIMDAPWSNISSQELQPVPFIITDHNVAGFSLKLRLYYMKGVGIILSIPGKMTEL